MKKPLLGWPKYKKKKKKNPNKLDFGWLGLVFIFWGVISLLTSWHFNNGLDAQKYSFKPQTLADLLEHDDNSEQAIVEVKPLVNDIIGPPEKPLDLSDDGFKKLVEDMSKAAQEQKVEPEVVVLTPQNIVGSIKVTKARQVFEIAVKADMPVQSWSFIEGEVLDSDKEYLFAFGKELWHETGRDSEGPWRENKNTYKIKVSFPHPGSYYLNFKIESNKDPSIVYVTVTKKQGSALPHFWFGVILLIIGSMLLNQTKEENGWSSFGVGLFLLATIVMMFG